MGQIWSKRQQNHHHHNHHQIHRPQPYPPQPPPPPPPQVPYHPPSSAQPPLPPSYAFAANAPRPALPNTPHPPPAAPPPPPPPSYAPHQYPTSSSYYNNNYSYNYNYSNYSRPVNMMGPHSNFHNPYYVGHGNGWFRPPVVMLPPPQPLLPLPAPAPYVDHQSAKKIKNDVNVHKDTIRLEVDEANNDSHLVSFTFDAMVDGSITIFYFAKEGDNCTFNPVYPEMHEPVRIQFQKGLGQKFCQSSGSGIDLGFFDTDDLSKPSSGDVFPLVISAESSLPSKLMPEHSDEEPVNTSPHAQITQAIIEKNSEGHFQVKVIKQILWVEGVRYELREIYGISDPDEKAVNDDDSGKECVICMTEPKDTAVLPCRHMCMCHDCAKELRLQTNKCPICRQPIQELLEIKVADGN